MRSTRLPGKILADLNGQPVLRRVIDRVLQIPSIGLVVVATSTDPVDDIVASRCEEWKIACYRGNHEDVLDRFYRAAALHRLTAVVRITADCPLLDPGVVERVVQDFLNSGADYASNVHPPTYPDGLDCEIMRIEALEAAWDEAAATFDREHVTPFIWRQPERFRCVNVESTANMSHMRWTVDTAEDLDHIRRLYRIQSDYRSILSSASQAESPQGR